MREIMKEESERAVVLPLIERATNSTAADVDPRLLKAIKYSVRSSDSEIQCAVQTLLSLMKRDHSQVRYLALLIIDELFMRSKLFRTLMVENLDQLLSLSIGFRRNLPLPAPASIASVLRSKAIEFLEKWNVTFGIHYRQLRLGYDYLKNTLRFQFPNLQANAVRIQLERKEREMRTKEILLKKFEFLKTSVSSIKEEIQSTVNEIGECLDILKTEDGDLPFAALDVEEIDEFRNSELRQIRHDSLREGEKIQENSENKIVFDALRELYKVLVTKHLAGIQEWLSVLIRVDLADNRFRDSTLKEFIDIKNLIRLTKDKCDESGCGLPNIANTKQEEDIWEDGTLPTFEKGDSVSNLPEGSDCPVASTADEAKGIEPHNRVSNQSIIGSHYSSQSESNPARGELLAEAPVIAWGSFLDNWGSNRDVLANNRGLDLEGHWGRVDYDAVIPAEKIAELNVRASVYKEEPVEIQPCRAPLRNGQLCQRRDSRVCPFHGRIIPRDDEGNPISESSKVEETDPQNQSVEMTLDVDSDKVEQLKQAVQNVRESDREEAKKRRSDKQALKRAKLAQVRAHNESVLREAAIASTSRSSHIGEDMEIGNGSKSSARIKNQTLASMLKKKDTVKDRLGQRLLNTRARESTIRQLTESEDANYREAFPNQW